MEVKIGVSNRHIHLKQEHVDILFGLNYELTKDRDLYQPNTYASKEYLIIKTDKDSIPHVRVLGPVRKYTQVEISKTDAYKLGINPPIRTSGIIDGTSPITLIGPAGTVELTEGCILANRHIHLTYNDLKRLDLEGVKTVSVKVGGVKGGMMDNVYLKTSDDYVLEMHIDTDDANGHLLKTDDLVTLIKGH